MNSEDIDLIAERVADLLRNPVAAPRLLTADQAARHLGVTRDFVYRHKVELGAVRLGDGPRAALRFDPSLLAAWQARHRTQPPAHGTVRGRPRKRTGAAAKLLPIRAAR